MNARASTAARLKYRKGQAWDVLLRDRNLLGCSTEVRQGAPLHSRWFDLRVNTIRKRAKLPACHRENQYERCVLFGQSGFERAWIQERSRLDRLQEGVPARSMSLDPFVSLVSQKHCVEMLGPSSKRKRHKGGPYQDKSRHRSARTLGVGCLTGCPVRNSRPEVFPGHGHGPCLPCRRSLVRCTHGHPESSVPEENDHCAQPASP